MAGKRRSSRGRSTAEFAEPLNHEQERMQKWLKQVRFKKTVFGGVKEADVWKKLLELNALYEAALSAERARYDALLAERTGEAQDEIDYDQLDDADYEEQDDADGEEDYLNFDEWDYLNFDEHGRVDDE